jgi:hypothetical protein
MGGLPARSVSRWQCDSLERTETTCLLEKLGELQLLIGTEEDLHELSHTDMEVGL